MSGTVLPLSHMPSRHKNGKFVLPSLLPSTSKQTKISHHCPYFYVKTQYKLHVLDYDVSGIITTKTKSHKAEAMMLYYFSKNILLKSCILLNGSKVHKNSVNYTLDWRLCNSYIRSLHVHHKYLLMTGCV